jgi:uncharacterized protein
VLTLGILARMEALLRERHGNDPAFRLSDYFDLIAGTSTGAIIAAALSLGMTVEEVQGHYARLGELVFKSSFLRNGLLRAKYPAERVKQALTSVFGDRCLDSPDFKTGLLVMSKRFDTGSAWPLTNNPKSRYFEGGTKATTIPNKRYPLWQVVRASTAAPSFFDPEAIQIGEPADGLAAVQGDFVDGGVTPSNNPTLQALMTATMEGYRLNWKAGVDQLLVVSVGTGKANVEKGRIGDLTPAAQLAVTALMALMEDCADQVESVMQWLSVSPTARKIDREIGTCQPPLGGAALCSYLRYNALLQADWCTEHLGARYTPEHLKALEAMDNLANVDELSHLGSLVGERMMSADHFPPAFDLPT